MNVFYKFSIVVIRYDDVSRNSEVLVAWDTRRFLLFNYPLFLIGVRGIRERMMTFLTGNGEGQRIRRIMEKDEQKERTDGDAVI